MVHPKVRKEVATRNDLRIGPLGTGSDFTAFIDHLGVASLNVSYGGEDNGAGVYHSIYDDFYWYSHFADSNYVYGRALAQTDGALGAAYGAGRCIAVRFRGPGRHAAHLRS